METAKTAIDGQTGTITFTRADVHNAFNPLMMTEIIKALDELILHSAVRVIVLRAEGKSFSAGADLQWMRESRTSSVEQNRRDAGQLSVLMDKLYTCPKPTIACVQGAVYGGGVGLVACADIALAEPTAVFCLSEVKLGLIPAVIAPYVTLAIGPRAMRRYMQTAEIISAHKAQTLGLVHEICDSGIEEKLLPILDHLRRAGPEALHKSKQLLRTLSGPSEEIKARTVELIADIRQSAEAQEGLSAFFDKRNPNWVDED